MLEYFDFLLFAHFSFILTPLFFASQNYWIDNLVALGLLSVGFVMRPIGGFLFGSIGDYIGRQKTISKAILWASLPSICIACIPTYSQIGYWATGIVLLCRIVQGLSMGGEFANIGIFLMEHAHPQKRCFYSSLLVTAGATGSLLALICVYIVVFTDTLVWAWRLPFLLSGVIGVIGYKLRQSIRDTPEYTHYTSRCEQWRIQNVKIICNS